MSLAIRNPYRGRATMANAQPAPAAPAATETTAATTVRRRRSDRAVTGGALVATTAIGTLVRLVRWAAAAVAVVIAAAILLRLLSANPSNSIVSGIHDAGRALVGPFRGMFVLKHHGEATLALNWGVAAIVYLIAGGVIAQALTRSFASARRAAAR